MSDVPSRVKGGDPVSEQDENLDESENIGNRSDDDDAEVQAHREQVRQMQSKQPESYTLNVRMSETLYKKIQQVARDEGVSTDDFACELLAEGIVLRAWEIVEKKSAMRGGNMGNQPQNNQRHGHNKGGGHQGQGGGNRGRGGHHKGRGNYSSSMNLLEDKAAFLEYVRNQEKRGR